MEENTEVQETTTATGEEVPAPPAEEKETQEAPQEEAPKLVPLAALEDERRKRQDLERQLATKATEPEPETYFDDPKKDGVFKDYIKSPVKVMTDIHSEIARLEAVIPDDGPDEYRKARQQIAYWNGIKDEFLAKRIEVSERQRSAEMEEAKVLGELGADAQTLIEYAKANGFAERDFKKNKAIREAVKKLYTTEHAAETAKKKAVPQTPHKAAAPAGSAGGESGDGKIDEFDPNISAEERAALGRKRRAAGG